MAGEKLENLISNQSRWDLVGPTVDDDVRRVIVRYGVEVVKAALKRQTKPKRGRKPELDWPHLLPVIEADARDWLAGNDPFKARTNYSIATNFANQKIGHSHSGDQKRIERKLNKNRVPMTLITAMDISRDGYSYMDHIRALEALNAEKPHEGLKTTLEAKRQAVADYEVKFGNPPPPTFSINDVEEQLTNTQFVLEGRSEEQASGGLGVLTAFINASLKRSIK